MNNDRWDKGLRALSFGYARVSTREQNLDRQLTALSDFGIEPHMVFADKASGTDFDRPEYRALMRVLMPDDVLVVKSIDRLGRDYSEILEEWRYITKVVGADIVVLDMPLLDTRSGADGGVAGTLISDIVLQLLSYVAQVERDNLLQRQAEGIAAARERGVHFGRPRKELPEEYPRVLDDYLKGRLNRKDSAEALGVSARTFARWVDAAHPHKRGDAM